MVYLMKKNTGIVDVLCGLLQKHNALNTPLTGKTRITSDLNIDSVEVMQVVMEVEDRFHVNIPVNDLDDVVTIEDLAAVISKRIGGR